MTHKAGEVVYDGSEMPPFAVRQLGSAALLPQILADGCAWVQLDQSSTVLLGDLHKKVDEFFALDPSQKERYGVPPDRRDGYRPPNLPMQETPIIQT